MYQMKKFSRCSLLGLICIWFIMGTPVLAQAPEQNLTDMTTLIRQLQQAGGNKVRVAYHRETGRVRFIGAAPDQPVGQPALRTNASSEEAARQFLTDYGALFGLKEPTQDLKVMKENPFP
jgi:hypothetical protein